MERIVVTGCLVVSLVVAGLGLGLGGCQRRQSAAAPAPAPAPAPKVPVQVLADLYHLKKEKHDLEWEIAKLEREKADLERQLSRLERENEEMAYRLRYVIQLDDWGIPPRMADRIAQSILWVFR